LQTSNKNLGDIIRSTRYKDVVLYGAEGSEVECKVIKKVVDGKRKTNFGSEWQLFCRINGFKEGDELRFAFVNMARSNVIKV
jgi:hypothetical protein